MPVQVQCPAKVNLFLEVTGRRRNGAPSLATLLARISLFDVLDLDLVDEPGFDLEVVDETGQGTPVGDDNTVLRAAGLFKKAFRLRMGVRLKLTKRIPIGAGLGGGSSDAAGTLIGLARLLRLPLDRGLRAKLRALGSELGGEVPFFLKQIGFADGRGSGDRLKPLSTAKALPWIILVFPGEAGPARDAYSRLKRPRKSAVLTSLSHLDTLKKKIEKGRPISEWDGLLFNRLEEAVLDLYPEVKQARSILTRLGLKGVLMSGPGSAVFGFASSQREGEQVFQLLRGYPWKVFLTCCLG